MTDTTPTTNQIEMYKAAIGKKNQAYYLEKFGLFDQEKDSLKPSWNWWAFLSFGTWALYRKMYGWAFIWVMIEVVMVVVSKIKPSDTFNWVTVLVILAGLVTLAIWIASGLYGNALYYRFINKKIRKAESADVNAEEQAVIKRLNRSSGVHAWVLYLTAASVLFIALCIVWMLFVIPKNDVAKVDELPSIATIQTKKENLEAQNLNVLNAAVAPIITTNKIDSSTVQPTKINDIWLSKALELEESRDRSALLEHTMNWTKNQPNSESAWNVLGYVYSYTEHYSKAVDANLQAIRISPENSDAWHNLGNSYENLEKYPEAIEAYKQAIRLNTKDFESFFALANAYRNTNQELLAIKTYQHAIEINPRYAEAYFNLGVAYDSTKQYINAANSFRQAMQLNPDYAESQNNIGGAYYKSGQRSKVVRAFSKLKPLDFLSAEKYFKAFILPKG
jgi:tetratricopeptide (TPR) repeat protein